MEKVVILRYTVN
uniref:Uncharacterized protein n=1 Tax=Anguilla anguilla TaxID=7936 RepID=A0A0E9R0R2_ANGAN